MMKHRMVCFSVVALVLIALASAQSSQPRSSSAKSGSDPLKNSTQPLTPKSAMPSHRKTPVSAPKATKRGSNTTAELTHLERQNSKATSPKSGSTAPAKSTPVKSATSGGSSKIDFKYQKPVGAGKAPPSATSAPRKQN